jgi:hypothetical protein
MMDIKFYKLKDDPCYGKQYLQIPQCERCWIQNTCHTVFKNAK